MGYLSAVFVGAVNMVLALFFAVSLSQNAYDYSSLAMPLTVLIAVNVAALTICILRNNLTSALFLAFLLYSIVPFSVLQLWLTLPLSNWRAAYGSPDSLALGATICALCISVAGASIMLFSPRPQLVQIATPHRRNNTPIMIALGTGLLVILVTTGTTRDEWTVDADIADRFILQISTVAFAAALAVAVTMNPPSSLGSLAKQWWLPVAMALVAAMQGYRFVFVLTVLVIVAAATPRLRLKPRQFAGLAFAAMLAGSALLLSASIRTYAAQQGVDVWVALQSASWTETLAFFGAAEQINLLAMQHLYSISFEPLYGKTYVDAFLRIPPNAIHTMLFDTVRPQDYIIQNFGPAASVFTGRGLNIGAHLVLEGLINFGLAGAVVACALLGPFARYLDRTRIDSSVWRRALRLGCCAYSFSILWYGSANSVKNVATFLVVYVALDWLGRAYPVGRVRFVTGAA